MVRNRPQRRHVREQGRRLRRAARVHETAEDDLSAEDAVEQTLERGELLIDAGRRAEAAALAASALALQPDDPQLLDLLATAQLELDTERALQTAERLIAIDPEGHRGHLLASIACDDLGRRVEAERRARAAIEAAPWLPICYVVLADSLVGRSGRRTHALAAANRAIELDPESPVGYLVAGNVEFGYGNRPAAESWYKRALEIDPTCTPAHTNLAHARYLGGDLNTAVLDVDTLLALDPQDKDARRVLDEIVYTTLIHVQWVVFGLAIAALILRQVY